MSAGRVALVTGGAVRVGRAIVEELAGTGWTVTFTYSTSAREAEELVDRMRGAGSEVEAVQADLAQASAWRMLADRLADRHGALHALVNNAAIFPRTPVDTLGEEQLREVLRINLEAPVNLTLACAPLLTAGAGAVVNLVDIYGVRPLRSYLAYSVSKAALIAATRALAVELAPDVRVNAVAPGIALFPDDYDDETRRRLVARTLLQREGSAGEIARTVRFLLEGTGTTTGQVLAVDGGRSLTW